MFALAPKPMTHEHYQLSCLASLDKHCDIYLRSIIYYIYLRAAAMDDIISLLSHICIPVALNIVVHPRLTHED